MNTRQTLYMLAIAGYTNGIHLTSPADFLAQISQAKDIAHTCSTAHRRATNSKYALDFNAVLSGDKKFTDEIFKYEDALFWTDMGQESTSFLKNHTVKWLRASDEYSSRTLWGDSINPNDIGQGDVGNCWLMASLSSFGEHPQRVMNAFVNKTTNANGIYGVNLYRLGVPNTVVIDDYLAVLDHSDRTIYAQLSEDNGLWGPFIEKAFAKFYGNFHHINGGIPSDAVEVLNGSPSTELLHDNPYNEGIEDLKSADEVFNMLYNNDSKNAIMTTGTPFGEGGDSDQMENGLYKSHAYSVIRAFILESTGDKLIEVRNPWGVGEIEHDNGYLGKWHDKDTRWTDALREEAGHPDKNDGVFIMDYKDFHASMAET